MAKKGKGEAKGGGKGEAKGEGEALGFERPPERIASPFKNALGSLKQKLVDEQKAQENAKKVKAPPAPVLPKKREKQRLHDDAQALSMAMHGVRKLDDKRAQRVTGGPKLHSRTALVAGLGNAAEDDARRRLDALIVSDVKFRIEREQEFVEGARQELAPRIVRDLARRAYVSDKLDLHGKTRREAADAVIQFVRQCHRLGAEVVCIVHGKGQHSEGGVGVLREAVVETLTQTLAAQCVRAFVTAPETLGGTGAMLVELMRR